MKILIAGGGTGGHVFPGIAVAEELQRVRRDIEVIFVGTRGGLEAQAVPEAGFKIRFLAGSGFHRQRAWLWPWAALVNFFGFLQALVLVLTENPQVVLGTGGYVSAPVAFAARLLGRPLILQEQNSVPGLANRVLARFANEVHLSFLEARSYFGRRDHLKITGNPVRAVILSGDHDGAMREFKLQPGRPTLFVFGGSLGASKINEAALDMLRRLKDRVELQCLLQTGRADHERVRAAGRGREAARDRAAVRAQDEHGVRGRRPGDLPLGRDDARRDRSVRPSRDPGAVSLLGAQPPAGQRREPRRPRRRGADRRRRADGGAAREGGGAPALRSPGPLAHVGERAALRPPRRGGAHRPRARALGRGRAAAGGRSHGRGGR